MVHPSAENHSYQSKRHLTENDCLSSTMHSPETVQKYDHCTVLYLHYWVESLYKIYPKTYFEPKPDPARLDACACVNMHQSCTQHKRNMNRELNTRETFGCAKPLYQETNTPASTNMWDFIFPPSFFLFPSTSPNQIKVNPY